MVLVKKLFIVLTLIFSIINSYCNCHQLPLDQHNEAKRILLENRGIDTNEPCDYHYPFLCDYVDRDDPELGKTIIEMVFDNNFKRSNNVSLHISSDLVVFKDLEVISLYHTISSEFFHNLYKFNKLKKVILYSQNMPINNNVTLNPVLKSLMFENFNTMVPEGFLTSPTLETLLITTANRNFKFPSLLNLKSSSSNLKELSIPFNSYSSSISLGDIANYFTNLEILNIWVYGDYNSTTSNNNELPEFTRPFKNLKRLSIHLLGYKLFTLPQSINNLNKSLNNLAVYGQIKVYNDKPIIDLSNFNEGFQLYIGGKLSHPIPNYRPIVVLPKNSSFITDSLNYSFKLIDFTNITRFLSYNNQFNNVYPDDHTINYEAFDSFVIKPDNNVDGECPEEYVKFKYYDLPRVCFFSKKNNDGHSNSHDSLNQYHRTNAQYYTNVQDYQNAQDLLNQHHNSNAQDYPNSHGSTNVQDYSNAQDLLNQHHNSNAHDSTNSQEYLNSQHDKIGQHQYSNSANIKYFSIYTLLISNCLIFMIYNLLF